MDTSALSLAAAQFREFLSSKLGQSGLSLTIGSPNVAQDQSKADSKHVLNLFFYRVEYDGPPDGSNKDPCYFRVHCLFTGFSVLDTETKVSPGEGDLRLLGRVMEILHENPTVRIQDESNRVVADLQVVPIQLSVTDINHIWSTQGELPYRLSLAYELALLPAPLRKAAARSSLVGSLDVDVRPISDHTPRRPSTLGFSVPRITISPFSSDWTPAIRFVDSDGSLRLALEFHLDRVPQKVNIVSVGRPDTRLDIVMERWTKNDGWQALSVLPDALTIRTNDLDPNDPPSVQVDEIPLQQPSAGQIQITAKATLLTGNGTTRVVASNPLLLSIHGGVQS